MPVNPSEEKFFELLAQLTAKKLLTPLAKISLADFRTQSHLFLTYAGQAADVTSLDLTVPARDGYAIPVRIYNSDLNNQSPVLFWYPGCGYVSELFEVNAIVASRIAKYSGFKVIAVNFRLTPEHPLPTPIYDAYDATAYIVNHANELGINSNALFISGLSSGAHCAAVVSILAGKQKDFSIRRQILLNGVYDLTRTHHEYDEYEKQDLICTQESLAYLFQYFGVSARNIKKPLFSPYYEPDILHLPPTTIMVAEYDGLRNDSEAYYQKLALAGNKVEKILLPGQTHNTILLRGAITDGIDPARVIADVLRAC